MRKLLVIVTLLFFVISGAYIVSSSNEQPPLVMLQASDISFRDVLAITSRVHKNQQRFYVFHENAFIVYNEERSVLSKVDTGGNFYPSDPVVDSEGNVYLINSANDQIVVLSPTGQWAGSFGVQERPYSLALLSNGNIVIASPNGGKLLHVYDTSGRKLRSFGDVKDFDPLNDTQNLFLNRGKVVVDSSDNVYFVFKYAPAPIVLKFSRKGKLISEFAIEGPAIDLQVESARRYLGAKRSSEVGSIVITNSATIDPSTGHLWICMNGSSRTGLVYEYSQKGKKLREYSFIIAVPSGHPGALTYVTDIIVKSPSLYVVVDGLVYFVSSDKTLPPGDLVFAKQVCPAVQPWSGCEANCPQGSCPGSRDCKAALQASVGVSPHVTGSTCLSLGPGQGFPPSTPPKPNGGCVATVTVCNPNTGVQTTTSTNLDCNPIRYACSGGQCVVNCDGTFTNSNCNNTCGGGGGGLAVCFESGGGEGGSGFGEICQSPILIDIQGNGFDLTDANNGVDFDIKPGGSVERTAWTSPGSDDAFLVLDRNGNGTIDDGSELFGNNTPQPPSDAPNGFLALAEYDKPENGGNGDGRITRDDAIFSSLRLWKDENHNGISEPGELHRLRALGLAAIDLDYKESRRVDEYGNWFRYRAKVRDAQGAQLGRWAWDVFLVIQQD